MTAPAATILIVEDDENLRLALADNLDDEGYDVTSVASVAAAEEALAGAGFDLIVLDIMLPDGDGYSLCERLRARGVESRVLMLTARTLEDDLVRGFEAGADDYLTKPYRLRELLARVAALLRRRGGAAPPSGFAGYALDRTARTLAGPDGGAVELTRTEFDLLAFLLDHRGRALTRQRILDAVWGDVIVDPRTVDNFVSNLKRKLSWTPDTGFVIRTIRGSSWYANAVPRRSGAAPSSTTSASIPPPGSCGPVVVATASAGDRAVSPARSARRSPPTSSQAPTAVSRWTPRMTTVVPPSWLPP